ncbi:MAG: aminoacyl-histidine dipeptidase [Proteobacteria bacterium]|nr:aminoacyl-histidine dipeptidase [Pseudomonadota bacterium]
MTLSDRVIDIFKAIALVPRQSKHEDKIAAWLYDRAKSQGFDVERDAANNIIVRVPATPGYENAPIIILQGHMDMVCEKTPESTHNFDTDPIEVIIEDGWMHAKDTSLGADDGLGVALALAMAEDKSIAHPALEILITSDEETGMTGAMALQSEQLKGRILLNLDSEDEGIFTVGCAGGRETQSTLKLNRAPLAAGMREVTVHVSGLHGGHSGCEIHLGRASAIKLAIRLISKILDSVPDARLIDIKGGSAHNAIPRDASFAVAVPAADAAKVAECMEKMGAIFASEYRKADGGVKVTTSVRDAAGDAYDNASLRRVCDMLFCYPHGIASMSQDIDGLVETSCNLASLKIEADTLHILSSQRSSVSTKLDAITARIEACVRLAGGTAVSGCGYPAWQPDMDSDILKRCIETYKTRFGREPKIEIIHAGLECGIIGSKIDGMQMISFGPTVKSPHCPQERAEVATIPMVADFLVDLLASYKA